MKLQRVAVLAAIAAISISVCMRTYGRNAEAAPASSTADSSEGFLGRWDLTLKAPDREYPSWLELREEAGQVKAEMVGRWGNARPLPKASIENGKVTFVSPKEEEDAKADMVFEGTLKGNELSGTVNGPDGKTWTWTGRRAPALKRTGSPKWGKAVALFNGKDLSGWKMSPGDSAKAWKVENGILTSPGN